MNTIKIILVVLVVASSLQSKGQKIGEIQGHWLVDIDETILRTNNYHNDKIKQMPPKAQEGLRKSLEGKEFDFDKKNKLKLKLKAKDGLKEVIGSWRYDEKTKKLATTIENQSKEFKIKWEGKDFIILDYGKKPGDNGTIEFLCLRRIN